MTDSDGTTPPPNPSPTVGAPGPAHGKPAPKTPPGPAGTPPPSPTETPAAGATGDPSLASNSAGFRRAFNDAGSVSDRQKLTDSANEALHVGNVLNGGTSVHGDLIGQLFQFGPRDAPVRPGELPRRLAEAAAHAYAGADELIKALEPFADRRVLIFCAPPGRGKLNAAIRVLQERKVKQVMLLRPDESLERLSQPTGDTGYILCDPSPGSVLSAHAVNTLRPLLENHSCHLVVTVSDSAPLGEEDLLDLTVPLPVAPRHADVLGAHLAWLLPERATALLADDRLTGLVTRLFQDDTPLRQAGELAQVIADVHRDTGDVDFAEVARRVNHRAEQAFAIWFDQLDAENRLHAIALAVLNGLPSEFVMEAVRSLRRRIEPGVPSLVADGSKGPGGPLTLRAAPDPFRMPRQKRLADLHAVVERRDVRGTHGVTRAETLRYADPSYAKRVLQRAWAEYTAQRVLLDWIGELVVHPADPVRIWAATAVGILATESFEYISRVVLDPWARSKSPRRRNAVAQALHVPADDPELRPVIYRMVREWLDALAVSEDGDLDTETGEPDRRAQATVARAYGSSLGRGDPDGALAVLHRLALADDIRVAVAVAESLAELVLADDNSLAEPILAMILQWLRDDDAEREGTGHLAFLVLAANLLIDQPAPEPGEPVRSWPLLLWMVEKNPALRYGIAAIWYHLLGQSSFFPQQAEDVLHQWAVRVDLDERGRQTLAAMLRTVCENDPGLRDLLLAEIDRWTAGEDIRTPTLNSAHAAYTAITEAGSRS
jgi:hypothetical protein